MAERARPHTTSGHKPRGRSHAGSQRPKSTMGRSKSTGSFKIGSIHGKLNYKNKEHVFPVTEKMAYAKAWKDGFVDKRMALGRWNMSNRCKEITCPTKGAPAWVPLTMRGQDTYSTRIVAPTIYGQSLIDVRGRRLKRSRSHYHAHPRPWSVSNYIDPRERAELDRREAPKGRDVDMPNYVSLYRREVHRMRESRQSKSLQREYEKYIQKQMLLQIKAGFGVKVNAEKLGETNGLRHFTERAKAKTKSSKHDTYDSDSLATYLETQTEQDSYVPHDILFYKLHKKRKVYRSCRDLIARQERRKHDIVREYYHEGKWQYSSVEDRNMWSCCGNYELHSQGCQNLKINLASWQFANG